MLRIYHQCREHGLLQSAVTGVEQIPFFLCDEKDVVDILPCVVWYGVIGGNHHGTGNHGGREDGLQSAFLCSDKKCNGILCCFSTVIFDGKHHTISFVRSAGCRLVKCRHRISGCGKLPFRCDTDGETENGIVIKHPARLGVNGRRFCAALEEEKTGKKDENGKSAQHRGSIVNYPFYGYRSGILLSYVH